MMGFLRKDANEVTNMKKCENSDKTSSLCTVVVKNHHLNQTHYLDNVNILTHFHNLLIMYCKSHQMDVKSFVFLVPSVDLSTRNSPWKVATPSMRIKDAILESLFDVADRKIYIQCVLKKDVPKYVTWYNCDSIKYTKVSNNAVKGVSYPPAPTPRRKRRAPPPPPIPIRRHVCRKSSKEPESTPQDTPTNTDYLDQTITKSISDISQINSSWSLNDNQELCSTFSTITIHAMEGYQDESSTSEHFFIPKPIENADNEDLDANSLSTDCRITPESSSVVSINEIIQPKEVDFDSFKEEHYEDKDYQSGFELELIKTKNNPPVNATPTKPLENSGISPLLKATPSTFAPFHVPNFEEESPKTRSSKSSKEDSDESLPDEGLQQVKAALNTINQQKVAPVPLRKANAEHRPSLHTNRDRGREKDWNGRFWCVDNRSRVLSFRVSEERQC